MDDKLTTSLLQQTKLPPKQVKLLKRSELFTLRTKTIFILTPKMAERVHTLSRDGSVVAGVVTFSKMTHPTKLLVMNSEVKIDKKRISL